MSNSMSHVINDVCICFHEIFLGINLAAPVQSHFSQVDFVDCKIINHPQVSTIELFWRVIGNNLKLRYQQFHEAHFGDVEFLHITQ